MRLAIGANQMKDKDEAPRIFVASHEPPLGSNACSQSRVTVLQSRSCAQSANHPKNPALVGLQEWTKLLSQSA